MARFALALSCLFASVAVMAQPVNDNFASALTMNGSAGATFGSNVDATDEASEPLHAGEPGGVSVWWNWTPPVSGLVTIDTIGSDFDTLLAIYVGASLATLQLVAENDEDPEVGFTSRVEFHAFAGVTYRLAVDGYFGEEGSIQLNWDTEQTPPPPGPIVFDQNSEIRIFGEIDGRLLLFLEEIDEEDGASALWSTNGLIGGAAAIRPFTGKENRGPILGTSSRIYFLIGDADELFADEVWVTDGTPEGTRPLYDSPGRVEDLFVLGELLLVVEGDEDSDLDARRIVSVDLEGEASVGPIWRKLD